MDDAINNCGLKKSDNILETQISKYAAYNSSEAIAEANSTIKEIKKWWKKDGDDKIMIILPPKEIEDKIKFIHNDVVAIDGVKISEDERKLLEQYRKVLKEERENWIER